MEKMKAWLSSQHRLACLSITFVGFLLSATSVADEAETGISAEQKNWPAQTNKPACDDSMAVEMQRRASFVTLQGLEPARQDAIRLALIDALQNVSGANIARSTQTSTTSTRSSLERETQEHLVLRSDGRVVAWEMLSEEISIDSDEDGFIDVVVRAEICTGADIDHPLVVALEEPGNGLGTEAPELRYKLADALGSYENLSIVPEVPINAYHDIKIVFDHSVDTQTVDNSAQARILQEFGASGALSDDALKYVLTTARATVMAVRFFDQETISETVTRRLRRPTGAQREDDAVALVVEAFLIAGHAVGERLGAGELEYSEQ
ncbi:hypothetical protein [Halomonas tibetensis]|uniref:Uncharacterized protein n=1 Tax=Halomonas tibetensis TaxID=2259590 RepID=A0ABV7B6X6_9GAMM